MVSLTLTVVAGLTPLGGYFSPQIVSPVPPLAIKNDMPEKQIVARLKEPTPTPTALPTPTPTNTPTPTPTPTVTLALTPTPIPAPVNLEDLFARFSEEFSVDKELLKRIAKCESSFNSEASFRDYVGMFQFASSSWSTIRARMNADPNPDLRRNAEEAIKTAAFHIANGGVGAWPNC